MGGFTTTIIKGEAATHDGIIRTLRNFYTQDDLELFLLYFAGHGEMLPEIGKFSLHCFGSEAEDTIGTLAFSELVQRIRNKVPASTALLIVDACRSRMYRGPQMRGIGEGLPGSAMAEIRHESGQVPRFWEVDPESQERDRQFLVTFLSCGTGQFSYEDSSLGHGIFTYGLVEELFKCAGLVPLSRIRKRVGDFTVRHCRKNRLDPVQIPEWIEPSISGEVYLGVPREVGTPLKNNITERRARRRFNMSLAARMELPNSTQNAIGVRIHDISSSGVFLESDSRIIEGQELLLHLALPANIAGPEDVAIRARGTVLRVREEINKWLAAIRLTHYEFEPM